MNNRPSTSRDHTKISLTGALLLGAFCVTRGADCDDEAPRLPTQLVDNAPTVPFHRPQGKELPSLGCAAGSQALTRDPTRLQYEFAYKVAECIQQKGADHNVNLVCDVSRDEGFWGADNQEMEFSTHCLAYTEDGVPYNQGSVYIGPACIDMEWVDKLGDLPRSECEAETYVAYSTNYRPGGDNYASYALNYEGFLESDPSKYGIYFDVFADATDLGALESDLETICSQTAERLMGRTTETDELIDMVFTASDAQQSLFDMGLNLTTTTDEDYLFTHDDGSDTKYVLFDVTTHSEAKLDCSVEYNPNADGTDIRCHPKDIWIEDNFFWLANNDCGTIWTSLSDIENSPEVVEDLMNCEPEYERGEVLTLGGPF